MHFLDFHAIGMKRIPNHTALVSSGCIKTTLKTLVYVYTEQSNVPYP